ncbi:O-antigen ligase family protein [Ornithinimicrobium pratense]|uniref:O-antigen ligase-related domain-containing protein n=1 Tax=Ornithinimicrobium pratense TaxID=2593973 RepID=A0A5J6V7C3_9MICO|nr:O-antigen ligase family protein [Ornithinimicrobium pratense]QFG69725.1 hypothetical protein FY030_14360 [Ornithinimicrobium pratense]
MRIAAGLAIFLAAAVGVEVVSPNSPVQLGLLVTALAFGVLLAAVPVPYLPAMALILFVAVPQQAVGYLNGASPAALALFAWALRKALRRVPSGRSPVLVMIARSAGVAVVLWSTFLLMHAATANTFTTSRNWIVSLTLAAVLPLFVAGPTREARAVWSVWPIVTLVAASYAAIEFLLQSNALFESLYALVGRPVEQQWAVYRSHASFGHPLYAATFFATSAAAGLARWLIDRSSLVWIIASIVGLTVTVSRGALLAVAAAAAVVFFVGWLQFKKGDLPGYRSGLVITCAMGVAALSTGLLQTRSGALEASTSSLARTEVLSIALATVRETGWRGTGAGTSDQSIQSWNDQGLMVESSPLQVLVSLGIPGSLAFAILIAVLLAHCLRTRNLAALGAIVAFVVAISGYNAIESLLPLHAFMGVLFLLVIAGPPEHHSASAGRSASTEDTPGPAGCTPPDKAHNAGVSHQRR